MAELGGLQLKKAELSEAPAGPAVAVATPPPLPTRGPTPVPVGSGFGAPARETRPAKARHPDGFPLERDIGILGKLLVWMLSLIIFAGGLAGWFLLFGYAGDHLNAMLPLGGTEPGDEVVNARSGSSLGAADAEDLEFLSLQLGIDRETLGLQGGEAAVPMGSNPPSTRTEDWPPITVTGIMAGAQPGDARVILDGVLVRVGDAYKGVRVVEVNNNAAALRYKEEIIWLFSGQSTAD